MEKLIYRVSLLSVGFLFSYAFCFASEPVLHFEKLGRYELEVNKFKKTKIGGLSAAFFLKDKLYALSDDRGRVNEPRFYVFEVKLKTEKGKLKVQVNPEKVVFIKANKTNDKPYLDGEGFAPLNENRFLVSCEGDNNSKPRKPPRIFEIDSAGNYLRDLKLPEELIPEFLGKQKNGIQNNSGFEGLSLSTDGKDLLAVTERQLLQDYTESKPKNVPEGSLFARFYKFKNINREKHFSENKKQNLGSEFYYYELDQVGVLSGISEVLSLKDQKYFIIERGVQAKFDSSISYVTTLTMVNLDEFKTVANKRILKKNNLNLSFGSENFEVLAWGPAWGKYSRTLWAMNDNNFSKNEKNVFLVYGVEEIPLHAIKEKNVSDLAPEKRL